MKPRLAVGPATKAIDWLLARSNDRQLVIGPLVWRPDGDGGRIRYLIAAAGDARGCHYLRLDVDPSCGEVDRAALLYAATQRGPLVIHNVGDELAMAHVCEALWPNAHTRRVREAVEAEVAGSS